MSQAAVIIPNWNGMEYLTGCLEALERQKDQDFEILMIDNGSQDGSVEYVRSHHPQVRIHAFQENTGFCRAVNTGIELTDAPYVILLNNDTVPAPDFVGELVKAISADKRIFSCQARMVRMDDPDYLDDAGDMYCALGWAYARGKGCKASEYDRETEIFASCGGAAIYRKEILEKIGTFDEKHFAYLEDIDLGYRAQIHGYRNIYAPGAVVIHKGSAATGSAYNSFKVKLASRNSVYLIYKNMPALQVVLNIPFLLAGFLIKTLFFVRKGLGKEYVKGLFVGLRMADPKKKVRFKWKNLHHYLRIQLILWKSIPGAVKRHTGG